MLQQINIKNFTIIDTLDLSLNHGMTVVTGETGAGKSIVIDAIELALGKRANNDVIKQEASHADISIQFNIQKNPKAKAFLVDNDLENENECLIRRTIHRDGRSKSYVNGVPITQQSLRELGDLLINIHGQHEFQTLLNRDQQLTLLDNFAHHDDLISAVNSLFNEWRNTKEKYDELNQKTLDIIEHAEFLKFQLQELTALNLQPGELGKINTEHQQLANADSLLSHCQIALHALSENEDYACTPLLYQAHQAMIQAEQYDERLKNISALMNNAMIHIDESTHELRRYLDHINLNPDRLAFLEERLAKIYELSKKHHVLPEELHALYEQMQAELNQIEHRDEQLNELKNKIEMLEKNYFLASQKLSRNRKRVSTQLEKMVTDNMQKLGMIGGKFSIVFEPKKENKPYALGQETVSFLVSANPGQPLQLLSKVASGGELSRISLAIQVITAQHSETPTLIFDEVDAGIGGGTAEIVGKLLNELSKNTQTLCVTHLPQVAARGHHHLRVEKKHASNQTKTKVAYLEKPHRIREIARMAGGIKITAQALAHAEMLLTNE